MPESTFAHLNLKSDLKMTYVRLGKSGLKISKVILGTMGYGDANFEPHILSEEDSLPLLKHAYDRGIRTWDTANMYSAGKSEEVIGKALKQYEIPRENVVLMTKMYYGSGPEVLDAPGKPNVIKIMFNTGEMVNKVGLSRKNILGSVEASVKRLGTYIDVLQIHRLDKDVEPEEIMRALNDVVESGKVRYLGASSMAAWQFQMLNNVAEKHGWHKFISMQNYHNLLYREEEREMIPYCQHAGIGIIPWSPLAAGLLTRPWRDDFATAGPRRDMFYNLLASKDDKPVIDRLEEVSKRVGKSMAFVATAWSLKKGVNPIVGLNSKERIDEAAEVVAWELPDEEFKALEEVYRPKAVAKVY